jgi:hypothetical protein
MPHYYGLIKGMLHQEFMEVIPHGGIGMVRMMRRMSVITDIDKVNFPMHRQLLTYGVPIVR